MRPSFNETMGLMFSSTVFHDLPSTISVHSTICAPDLSSLYLFTSVVEDVITNSCVSLCLCASVPPVFKQKINPVDINVGDHAKFDCETEDAPNVTFKWYKSGIEIRQSDKYRIVSRHNGSSLEILHPLKADSGDYTCKASNQHGYDSCSASLVVTGKIPVGTFQIITLCVC